MGRLPQKRSFLKKSIARLQLGRWILLLGFLNLIPLFQNCTQFKYAAVSGNSNNNSLGTNDIGVTISSTVIGYTNQPAFSVNVNFTSAVQNFSIANLVITNGSGTNFAGSNNSYTLNVTAAGQGPVSISIPTGVVSGPAGDSNAASNFFTVMYDSIPPSVVLSSTVSGNTSITPIPISIVFSEPVTPLALSAFTVSNGVAGELSGSGTSYTMNVTPMAAGPISVQLNGGGALDLAGNPSVISNSLSFNFTSLDPSTIVTSTLAGATNLSVIPMVVTFSKAVTGFSAAKVTLTNATLSGFSGAGTTYQFNLAPTAQGDVAVVIPAAAAVDQNQNPNLVSNKFSIVYDSFPPMVSLSSTSAQVTELDPIPVTVTFSENVTGFSLASLNVSNASAGGLSGSGAKYSFFLNPLNQGVVSVSASAGAAKDIAGNLSQASATLTRTFDGSLMTGNGCKLTRPGDCDSPIAAYSINDKIVSSYPKTAPLFRAVRIPDLAETDVLQPGQGTYQNGTGTPDTTQVSSWLADAPGGSGSAVVTTIYDQSGKGNDASQSTIGAAPRLRIDPSVPALASLSLIFGNDTAQFHAAYAKSIGEGSALIIKSLTDADPSTLSLQPSPTPPGGPHDPVGAPFPKLPSPESWILPGYLIQDTSLPTAGLPVISGTSKSFLLGGTPLETSSFSKTLTVVPQNVWLDIPLKLSVNINAFTVVMAVRPGYIGSQYYATIGQLGESAAGSGAYASFYNNSGTVDLSEHDPSSKVADANTNLFSGTSSTDIDVYEVSRNGSASSFNLGENGSGSHADNFKSAISLSGGSIGFTKQVSNGAQGSFEGYDILIYSSSLSANDTIAIQDTIKNSLASPPVPTTQVVYSGASTVIGHGIDSVEAPAKRIGVDMAAQTHPVKTFTSEHLSEELLKDLQNGGPVSSIFKNGAGTNVLVIHPTVADSFAGYNNGNWPSQCGAVNSMPFENCLWTIVSLDISLAHTMGWKVLLLGTEPKSMAFSGTGGLSLSGFLNFKALEVSGWKAAGADGYVDFESDPAFGGSDGKGGLSHCTFWRSMCTGYLDPNDTTVYWQPDASHLSQMGYDLTADIISAALIKLGLY